VSRTGKLEYFTVDIVRNQWTATRSKYADLFEFYCTYFTHAAGIAESL